MTSDYTSSPSGLPFVQKVYGNFTPELQWTQNMMISFVLRGSLDLRYNSRTRHFNVHDIFFILPFETLSVITSTPDAMLLTLTVEADYIRNLVPDFSSLSLRQHHIGKNLGDPVYYGFCRNFASVVFHNMNQTSTSKFQMLKALSDMLITVLENFTMKSTAPAAADYTASRINDILAYINNHYKEKIAVWDIARYLGIHPQYFSSFFTKNFHVGFAEYLAAYRVNASLNRLLFSNDSILNIALENGFSNHKTYGSAFQRLYHMTPSEYRKNYRKRFLSNDTERESEKNTDPDYSIFDYLHRFLTEDTGSSRFFRTQTLSFDAEGLLSHSRTKKQIRSYTLGRAVACLRHDLQEQIRQAKTALNIDYFRVRDIFSDSLYVYYENEEKEPIFNWQALDNAFDFILSTGAKPFPEIGYMPEKLASKKQYAGLQFRPNVSAPKSAEKWKKLVKSFLLHYIYRYGIDEVSEWYFDFWTSPDLNLKMAYWYETMEDFFEFYRITYEVFREVNPALRLGTPNFSTISGFPWYHAFFRYCREHDIHPDYVSFHTYGCDVITAPPASLGLNDVDGSNFTISNQMQVRDFLVRLRKVMCGEGFSSLGIIISDFCLNFMPMDLTRDTCYMAAYLAHTTIHTLELTDILGHWAMSDIHEDAYPTGTLFYGGPGFMNYQGLKKASYNAMALLGHMGDVILERGENYLLSKQKNVWQLYIYNLARLDTFYSNIDKTAIDSTHRYNIYRDTEDLHANIILTLPAGSYYIKKFEVNRTYGSAYDIWGQMGFPEDFSKDMEDYLREKSVPHITYSVQDVENALILDEIIPAHGLMLLEIWKR
ncbi:MAG: helix-turn-helix domain-containing protein [Clostridiales bacterium]|nr:helix-turn-helix domain-containing protein [Clostridiales bacterium]